MSWEESGRRQTRGLRGGRQLGQSDSPLVDLGIVCMTVYSAIKLAMHDTIILFFSLSFSFVFFWFVEQRRMAKDNAIHP